MIYKKVIIKNKKNKIIRKRMRKRQIERKRKKLDMKNY